MLGWAKNLNATPDYILYEISHANLVLYTRATPYYDDEKNEWDESIDANNPNNFTQNNKEIFV